eukprot:6059188-Amphidinium_carterae.1
MEAGDAPQDVRFCRICLAEEGEDEGCGRLLSPCNCSGTSKYVHQTCFRTWLQRQHKEDQSLAALPSIFSNGSGSLPIEDHCAKLACSLGRCQLAVLSSTFSAISMFGSVGASERSCPMRGPVGLVQFDCPVTAFHLAPRSAARALEIEHEELLG